MQDGGPPQQIPNGTNPPLRSRVTVVGIPSVTIENNRLRVGTSETSSTRSYTPLKVLGNGSFGTVTLCDWHGDLPPGTPLSPMQCGQSARPQYAGMQLVAVKRMRRRWEGGWDECQKLKELESLRAIPFHPNIIPLYDFFLLPDTRELYFVFESMEGNLYNLIKVRRGRLLAGGLVASIFRQIALGLDHIHSNGYFHRDMKPENVLVTTTGLFEYTSVSPVAPPNAPKDKDVVAIIKLADFGLARETSSAPPYTEYVSTRWYRAPEVLLFSRDYSNPVDMWAFGTIMAELANLRPLFPGSEQIDQIARICDLLGDPSDEYGYDMNGSLRGGGPWPRGIQLAASVGYQFPKSEPKDLYFMNLFDKSIPRSLIYCIRDLLRYDPAKRLTSRQCVEHPYLLETLPRNNIEFPPGLQVYAFNHQIPSPSPYTHGSQSSPSLVSPPHAMRSPYSQSAHSLHLPQRHPQHFPPDGSINHRIPYPTPPIPQFIPPPAVGNAPNDFRQRPPEPWTDSQNDYPMDDTPSHNQPPGPHNGHAVDNPDSPMAQVTHRHPEPSQDAAPNHGQSHNKFKLGAISSTFGKKPSTWRLGGMFGGDRSHHHSALPPVDETSPAVSFPSRKRAQSSSTDSHSVREPSPQRAAGPDTRDAKKNKKEAERLNREAEMERRRLADKTYRDRAREVMVRRRQILEGSHEDIEWHPSPEERTDMVEQSKNGKVPASGPIRRDRDPNNAGSAMNSASAAGGKFAPPGGEAFLQPPERDREWRSPSDRVKARRREFDDDHSMSSSDVHTMSRMSSMSFVTVDSDPGPSRIRHRPSVYNMSRRTSRSSLRTSFDDYSASSARSSHSYSLEGQLVHDFRTQASVTSNFTGNISPPPLHSLSLSPSMSPSLSPSPPWMQVQQQHKEDLLALTHGQSPPYISISPGFAPHQLPTPTTPYDPPGSYGYPPSSGHTPKSAKSAINPIFKVASLPPPPPLPLSSADDRKPPNMLPPFSQLEAAAGGELPPLSPMIFTTPTEDG